MNRLSLAATSRITDSGTQTLRQFLDFVIDGQPMYPALQARGFDLISALWIGEPAASGIGRGSVLRLLGEAEADASHGRVTIYVCPECGDLGCGAVTVQVTRDEEIVRWQDWGYQNNYQDEVFLENLDGLEDLTFSRAKYENTLRHALDLFDHQ